MPGRSLVTCRLLAGVAVLVAATSCSAVAGQPDAAPARRVPPAGVVGPPPGLQVLHRWDARRSRAYAAGSVAGLRALYVPGSAAGRADVRLLRAYAARGYRVRGLRMQVLAVTVLSRRPGRWRLRVTDRLARAVAVRDGARTVLPRDQASTRVVALVRGTDGRWRVAAVRELSAGP